MLQDAVRKLAKSRQESRLTLELDVFVTKHTGLTTDLEWECALAELETIYERYTNSHTECCIDADSLRERLGLAIERLEQDYIQRTTLPSDPAKQIDCFDLHTRKENLNV
jgi:hypothetical protein